MLLLTRLMTHPILRIATRKSPLALWQASHVAAALKQQDSQLETQLLALSTTGDNLFEQPLSEAGGKSLFVKELETALLDGSADIAVHSMKDVPITLPYGLVISTIMQRNDPSDALVSNQFATIDELPANAIVGTSSLRRQCQLLHHYPALTIKPLRGNLDTRLKRLDDGNFDAIILASAGLKRLQYEHRIKQRLSFEISLPAIGQGAIGIECRIEDQALRARLATLHHDTSSNCVAAERAVNETLGGDCRLPIAAYAEYTDTLLHLKAIVGNPDGTTLLYAETTAAYDKPQQAGSSAAQKLLADGAESIINNCRGIA